MEKEKEIRKITDSEEKDVSGGKKVKFNKDLTSIKRAIIKPTMVAYGGPEINKLPKISSEILDKIRDNEKPTDKVAELTPSTLDIKRDESK